MISEQDLRAHINAVRDHLDQERAIGFSSPHEVAAPEHMELPEGRCRVLQTSSELGIRAALLDLEEATDDELLVIVTPLERRELGTDVLARLARQRLFHFDPWEAVLGLLDAIELDGRLRPQRALGRALLRASADASPDPVRAGQLTEQDAWRRLLHDELGLPEPLWSLESWIEWSILDPAGLRRLLMDRDLTAEAREQLRAGCGEAGELLLDLLERSRDEEQPGRALLRVSLGVRAAQAATDDDPSLRERATHVRGDLTGALGLAGISQRETFDAIAAACSRTYSALERDHPGALAGLVDELDALLERVEAGPITAYSRASRAGWGQRLEMLAGALEPADPYRLREVLDLLADHDVARQDPGQLRRLRAAAQLAVLAAHHELPPLEGVSTAALARDYIRRGSFEDMLRAELASADLGPQLHDAVAALLDRLTARRDRLHDRFARTLLEDLAHRSVAPGTLAMHQVLERVVAPLARRRDVLLIVLDGASWGVMRSLHEASLGSRWATWVPTDGDGAELPLLAALPSVTGLSRTALLTGKLQTGTQALERAEFEQHPRLREAVGESKGLALFHKGDLDREGVGGVGAPVREAILDEKLGVVGVVVNAVDDQLKGAQQLAMRWDLDAISPLRSLLDLAHRRRLVILTSDHGHVWEDRSRAPEGVEGSHGRHRLGGGAPVDGEARLQGPMARAFAGDAEADVVLAVHERLRYSSAHRGYHGGASLQEVVAPLLLLTGADQELGDAALPCQPLRTYWPAWRELRTEETRLDVPRALSEPGESAEDHAPAPAEPSPQLDLTSLADEPSATLEEPAEVRQAPADHNALVMELLNCEVYGEQLERVPNLGKMHGDVYIVLVALLERDGRAHEDELARELGKASTRTRRLLTALRHALNRDGYGVLTHERRERVVRLDRDLLIRQFELEGATPEQDEDGTDDT